MTDLESEWPSRPPDKRNVEEVIVEDQIRRRTVEVWHEVDDRGEAITYTREVDEPLPVDELLQRLDRLDRMRGG